MKCTCIGGKRCNCNCSCFEIDQEMDAILLIIGIVYGVCRIVIKFSLNIFYLSQNNKLDRTQVQRTYESLNQYNNALISYFL